MSEVPLYRFPGGLAEDGLEAAVEVEFVSEEPVLTEEIFIEQRTYSFLQTVSWDTLTKSLRWVH